MITNDREFQSVLCQLQELRSQRDTLLRDSAVNPFQLHIEVSGMEKMMARLQDEINAFEAEQQSSGASPKSSMFGVGETPIPNASINPKRRTFRMRRAA